MLEQIAIVSFQLAFILICLLIILLCSYWFLNKLRGS